MTEIKINTLEKLSNNLNTKLNMHIYYFKSLLICFDNHEYYDFLSFELDKYSNDEIILRLIEIGNTDILNKFSKENIREMNKEKIYYIDVIINFLTEQIYEDLVKFNDNISKNLIKKYKLNREYQELLSYIKHINKKIDIFREKFLYNDDIHPNLNEKELEDKIIYRKEMIRLTGDDMILNYYELLQNILKFKNNITKLY